jgi:hypothetical protein
MKFQIKGKRISARKHTTGDLEKLQSVPCGSGCNRKSHLTLALEINQFGFWGIKTWSVYQCRSCKKFYFTLSEDFEIKVLE